MIRVAAWSLFCALLVPVLVAAQAPSERPKAPGSGGGIDRNSGVTYEELHAVRPNLTRERFDQLDKDGDGILTRGEAPRPPRGNGMRPRLRLLQKVMASDADGDGKVSYSELTAAKPGFPDATFQRLDANKDGYVSPTDAQRMTRTGDRPVRPAADRTSDGSR